MRWKNWQKNKRKASLMTSTAPDSRTLSIVPCQVAWLQNPRLPSYSTRRQRKYYIISFLPNGNSNQRYQDELLHHDILSKEEYITKLKALLESNHRLPTKEIMKRIEDSFWECAMITTPASKLISIAHWLGYAYKHIFEYQKFTINL